MNGVLVTLDGILMAEYSTVNLGYVGLGRSMIDIRVLP